MGARLRSVLLLVASCRASALCIHPAAAPHAVRPLLAAAGAERRVRRSPRMEPFSFDPFDREVFRILMDAQTEARVLGSGEVRTDHLLFVATMEKDDVQSALQSCGVTEQPVRQLLRAGKGGGGAIPGLDRLFAVAAKDELLPFAADTERALKGSVAISKGRGGKLSLDQLVDWKELMLAVLRDGEPLGAEDDSGDGGGGGGGGGAPSSALAALEKIGADRAEVVRAVETCDRELVGAGKSSSRRNSTLTQCSVDLTQQARDGKLDPLIGRSAEVRRAMQILVRRRKNNPVLIGDPGVGKTAIAEGIAQRIVDDDVPKLLRGRRLLSLELGLLVADTKYRGEFEQRLKEVIEEVSASVHRRAAHAHTNV